MDMWARLKNRSVDDIDTGGEFSWKGMSFDAGDEQRKENEQKGDGISDFENRPLEPEARKSRFSGILKWTIFLLVIAYSLMSYYRVPFLTRLGAYLVVQHPLEKADLIVCMLGNPVERGMMAADIYHQGFAPYIFVAREESPDGVEILKNRGAPFPEERDCLINIFNELGVPPGACLVNDQTVGSTFEEAKVVRDVCRGRRLDSVIIVTSPTHTRRVWLTFKHVLGEGISIIVVPSSYSGFKPETWWKSEKYVQSLLIEYQKLIFYKFRYF